MSASLRRRRLALGRYSQDQLGDLHGRDGQMDGALDFLNGREYSERGLRGGDGPLDPTQLTALSWLGKARGVSPDAVFETLQSDALNRCGLSELFQDPDVLAEIEPHQELLPALLGFHGRAPDAPKATLRAVAQKVIDQIMEQLKPQVDRAFSGRRNRFMRSNFASSANFDWRATLREKLSRNDPERQRIIAQQLQFNARVKRRLAWTGILCVDQSGSMTDSVIHAAVLAAIVSGLPGVRVKMVLFDSSVVDVTDRLSDPIDTLLSVQLGGGTNIGQAMQYCEGGSGHEMLGVIARLSEARVTQLGLPTLDHSGRAWYNHQLATETADLDMEIGAMSPDRFAPCPCRIKLRGGR